jgi:AcrR family transcriptional regulator
MSTKERILDSALSLFNKNGIDRITVRHIAGEMGISHGNLCYHFPRKEDIIYTLYRQLVSELDALVSDVNPETINIKSIYGSIEHSFKIMYKYKFLFIDLVSIIRNIQEIESDFKKLYTKRKVEFRGVFDLLIYAEYMKKEVYKGQYDLLFYQFFMLGNAWLPESEILFKGTEKNKLKHYIEISFGLLVPLLTDKGLKEYTELRKIGM